MSEYPPTLHVYGPRWWHDSATIIGDRAALERLRQLIDMALESSTAGSELMTQDGEGFHMRVICAPIEHEYWNLLKLPYRDEGYEQPGKVWPSDG